MKKQITLFAISIYCIAQVGAQSVIPISGDGKNYQVLDLTGMEKIQWGGNDQIGVPAGSDSNGSLNTKSIVMAVGANNGYEGRHYAAKVCDTIHVNGMDDWYLPAKNEAAIIYTNIASFNWSTSMTLWTSTEASGTQAVSLYLYDGSWWNVMKVDSYNLVCIRKVE